ncbi:MAG: exodeoxyribonuclease VII small subunit [Actinomycetia bacterium]|nr:exodeoxyribonuclease VII small subunit [Actinomycetes bacterium]
MDDVKNNAQDLEESKDSVEGAEACVEPVESEQSPSADPQSYSDAKARLDEIVKQVRAKDVSLERSLDLLEEGVKLANQCTELIDQTRWEDEPEDVAADDTEPANDAGAANDNDFVGDADPGVPSVANDVPAQFAPAPETETEGAGV